MAHTNPFEAHRLAIKRDLEELQSAFKRDLREFELRLKHGLTVRFGAMLSAAVAVFAALVKLL